MKIQRQILEDFSALLFYMIRDGDDDDGDDDDNDDDNDDSDLQTGRTIWSAVVSKELVATSPIIS